MKQRSKPKPAQMAVLLALLALAGCGQGERIPTRPEPGSLALDARGRTLFIACEGGPTVMAWDLQRRRKTAEVQVGTGPIRLQLDRERDWLYVLCRGARRLLVFQAPDLKPVKTLLLPDGPSAWVYDPEQHLDLVCSPEANLVRVFIDKNPLPAIEAGAEPVDLLLQPGGDKLWVAGYQSRELALVSLDKSRVIKRVPVKPNPLRLQLSAQGDKLYVLCTGRDAVPPASVVQEVDLNYQVGGLTYAVGQGVRDFALGALGRHFFCILPDGLDVTALATGIHRRIRTGGDPQAVAVAPDESVVYVSSRRERAVYVYSLDKLGL